MGSSRIRHAAIAALLVAGLAACDDDPEVDRDPGATASGTSIPRETSSASDPSPTGPVEPTLPAEAEEGTKAGAAAFVEYYWDAASYSWVTGATDTLATLGGQTCQGCANVVSLINDIYAKGGTVESGPYRVTSRNCVVTGTSTAAKIAECRVTTRSTEQIVRVPEERTKRLRPATESAQFTMTHTDGRWRIDVLEPA